MYHDDLKKAIKMLMGVGLQGRNLEMGDPRYMHDDIRPLLGYDQWAGWLIIVEWSWLKILAELNIMPSAHAKLLTDDLLQRLLSEITTTMQDRRERGQDGEPRTNHDILALLELMRRRMPLELHQWLHLCATSYDIVCCAYAVQAKVTFETVYWPKLREIDAVWRELIDKNAGIIQDGRTHLQKATGITIGFWLATLHSRFVQSAHRALKRANAIEGKFSGAVGNYAAQRALFGNIDAERFLTARLSLTQAPISTQIVPPESLADFYFSLFLLSGCLGNLGEDVRLLQCSMFGEVCSDSSSSSTMAHKNANPIAAENDCGMHVNVGVEMMRLMLTQVSDLQRDLRWSSVTRGACEVMIYGYSQLGTTLRLLKSLKIDSQTCWDNFAKGDNLIMGELLHLALQMHGGGATHQAVNSIIVPRAKASGITLDVEMEAYLHNDKCDPTLAKAWEAVPQNIKKLISHPDKYLGDSILIAKKEAKNAL